MTLNEAVQKAEDRFKDMDFLEGQDGEQAHLTMREIRDVYKKYKELCAWKPDQSERWELEAMTVLTEHFITMRKLYKKAVKS